MKKYILSPFCSAFIVPGLGQVINEQIKKGLLFLGLVFVLLIAVTVKLAVVINRLMSDMNPAEIDLHEITDMMMREDLSLIAFLAFGFALVWIYSVIDAFWVGFKIEQEKARE